MRYIIYGAGGVGGTIGGRLFHGGHDTVLICRGDHLTAIQERGMTLVTHDLGTVNCPSPPSATRARSSGPRTMS